MLIKTGYPNLLHACDFLCFNLMNYYWVRKVVWISLIFTILILRFFFLVFSKLIEKIYQTFKTLFDLMFPNNSKFVKHFPLCVVFSTLFSVFWNCCQHGLSRLICSGNRTEWSPIRSVIIRVITKSDDRAAGVRFVHHEYDYRPNWKTRITN